eukprot:TRINITY_DN18425_c0_g1_i1.p1 TRINITY_DN18425_c0_g1~~TRINITY_DN18425_c0_g1_i1.p1  ORF type:complete len:231 (+),score=32.88 TRINITY_DN18425_c0_g1_i1:10-702(+)
MSKRKAEEDLEESTRKKRKITDTKDESSSSSPCSPFSLFPDDSENEPEKFEVLSLVDFCLDAVWQMGLSRTKLLSTLPRELCGRLPMYLVAVRKQVATYDCRHMGKFEIHMEKETAISRAKELMYHVVEDSWRGGFSSIYPDFTLENIESYDGEYYASKWQDCDDCRPVWAGPVCVHVVRMLARKDGSYVHEKNPIYSLPKSTVRWRQCRESDTLLPPKFPDETSNEIHF